MEQQSLKLYPVGIQAFPDLRTGGYLYIDKTEQVYRMTHSASRYMFLSRPRRFGKSLLVSTLHAYFEGRKELFQGLAMERLEKEWTQYPVLHFDMSTGKNLDAESLILELERKLLHYEAVYGRGEGDVKPNQRLQGLIERAYKKTGQRVVVLIDDYDAPLLDVMHDEKKLSAMRNVIFSFYNPLKPCEPYLRYVFLTGITRYVQPSMFGGLNNIQNISMDEEYAAICGVTEEEMRTQMDPDLDVFAAKLHTSKEDLLNQLKDNYGGYHFTWPSPDIYNPNSLFNAFREGKIDSFGSGIPAYLIEMLRKYHKDIRQLGNTVNSMQDCFDAPIGGPFTSDISLLYQNGYYTIQDYIKLIRIYTLGIPNREVRSELMQSLNS